MFFCEMHVMHSPETYGEKPINECQNIIEE